MKELYGLLALIGFILPYYFFISFLAENGPNPALLLRQLFASHISTFFALDLNITALAFWVFLFREAGRWRMRNRWLYLVATLTVGPSFALPLFLCFREARMEAPASQAAA